MDFYKIPKDWSITVEGQKFLLVEGEYPIESILSQLNLQSQGTFIRFFVNEQGSISYHVLSQRGAVVVVESVEGLKI